MEKNTKLLLQARAPMMWVSTLEEDHTLLRIQAAAEELGYVVFEWTCIGGFGQLSSGTHRQPGNGQCTNLDQALRAVAEYKHGKSLFVFRDFQLLSNRIERNPEYVTLVRQLKQLYRALSGTAHTLLFLAASPTFPPELKDELALIEAALPDAAERLAIVQTWIEANCRGIPCELDAEAIHRIMAVSAGMTSRQIQSALARSAVKRKGIKAESLEDILEEKVSVVKTSEVLDYIKVEASLDDVGGLTGIKDFMAKRAHAFSPAAARYGLPVPRGVLFLGPPGVGKSLMAKVTASIFQIPLLRFDIGRLQGSLVGQSEERMRIAFVIDRYQHATHFSGW